MHDAEGSTRWIEIQDVEIHQTGTGATAGRIAQLREMAERVGFEPTEELPPHLISSQARSTGLRHLSARAETYPKIR